MSFDRDALARTIAARGAVVRIVVADVQGSAPREAGTSMLVWADGQAGTIGGGALEYRAAAEARAMLSTGAQRRFSRAILGPDMGQCCGGAVALLFERFEAAPDIGGSYARPIEAGAPARGGTDPDWPDAPDRPALLDGWFIEPAAAPGVPVWIWGAGHVGRALTRILAPLPGLSVTLVDTAPERFPDPVPPGATPRIAPGLVELVPDTPTHAHHLILSYSHDLDFALCDALLGHGFASAGLIGSATKWARFRSRLVQRGRETAAIDRIRCPIGTPALGKDPATIALGTAHALLMDLASLEAAGPAAIRGTG